MPTLKQIFETAIDLWMKNDVRTEVEINEFLQSQKEAYEKLEESKKQYFDLDYLTNPYSDSKIYHWEENTEIKKLIIWVDVEWSEILAVNEYNKLNPKAKIDAILWHHPEWKALVDLTSILKTVLNSVDMSFWIPINQVEKLNCERVWKLQRWLSPLNYNRWISIAKMLDIPFFWIHTPADNMCFKFMQKMLDENKSKTKKLKDIIALLEEIPEMQMSKKNGIWPQIWAWSEDSLAWIIALPWITWGTSGSKDMYQKYAEAWIWTILVMHISEDHLEEAKKHNLNVIMTDHMASDSLWLNLIADEYEKAWVEIIEFSWFMRFSRVKEKEFKKIKIEKK